MTQSRIQEIKQRLEKATPGDWASEDSLEIITTLEQETCFVAFPVIAEVREDQNIGSEQALGNTEFIAHAPSDISYLLAEVEQLRALASKVVTRWYRDPPVAEGGDFLADMWNLKQALADASDECEHEWENAWEGKPETGRWGRLCACCHEFQPVLTDASDEGKEG